MPADDQKRGTNGSTFIAFSICVPIFPVARYANMRGPDFLITTDQRHKIGIEIGRVYKDYGKGSEQSIEATKEAITVAARAYCENVLKTPPAFVSLYFTLSRHLKRKAREGIAQRVARAVHENMPPEGRSVRLEYRSGGAQPIEVDLILISRVGPRATHKWI